MKSLCIGQFANTRIVRSFMHSRAIALILILVLASVHMQFVCVVALVFRGGVRISFYLFRLIEISMFG